MLALLPLNYRRTMIYAQTSSSLSWRQPGIRWPNTRDFIQITVEGKSVPLQAWTGPEGSRKLRFPDFVTTAQDGGKVVGLTHRPPLPPGNAPGAHFCYGLSRPQGHSAIGRILSMKNPVTPAGIEPATFRFVAHHLNHCATAVPYSNNRTMHKYVS